jgi:nitronate monooxygenase
MPIHTDFTKLFSLDYPVVSAPMGGIAGGALAAAVSNAGGLGLVGGGYGDIEFLEREMAAAAAGTTRAWGVGVITWAVGHDVVELALSLRPHAFVLSFGDPRPYAKLVKRAGVPLICQVQDLAGLQLALEAGADAIVAEGTEAGGHGGSRGTLPFVPAVVDRARGVPVLAAGGIADGRGLAAALMLGAAGALLGTRYYASSEARGFPAAKARIVAAAGEDTARTRVFDIVRGYDWPRHWTGRAIRNAFFDRWHADEAGLQQAVVAERKRFEQAGETGDCDVRMVWASEAIDLIGAVEGAGALTRRIGEEAARILREGARLVGGGAP